MTTINTFCKNCGDTAARAIIVDLWQRYRTAKRAHQENHPEIAHQLLGERVQAWNAFESARRIYYSQEG